MQPAEVGFRNLIKRMKQYIQRYDFAVLRRAYEYASVKHGKQKRRSGEPFLYHPLNVAHILADMEMEPTCIVVALIHDVVEDTPTQLDEVKKSFGDEVARLVDGVSKLDAISYTTQESRQAENFRKLMLAVAGDIRVILIKLADRLHNMRTLKFLAEETRKRKARETLEIYAPLAYRLGLRKIKDELEDLAFRHLYPDEYSALSVGVEKKRKLDRRFIQTITGALRRELKKNDIAGVVEWRVKSLFSIYKKLKTKYATLDEVYDYLAFRVIVKSSGAEGIQDCYKTMGLLHGIWKPVPGRIKDFIAIPKPNNYQSLHTTLMTTEGHPFEIQIRTETMHTIAEEGVAAHWQYKEGDAPVRSADGDTEVYRWLRHTAKWLSEVKEPHDFLDSVKLDFYPDEIYVFTPKGDVLSFPRGATPVDFAYRVHTNIGHKMTGARINGRIAPIDTPLKNGDRIEILTGKHLKVSKDWLKIAATPRARAKIKAWFKQEESRQSTNLGKEILTRYFRKHGADFSAVMKDKERTKKILNSAGVSDEDSLYAGVGFGRILPQTVFMSATRLAPPKRKPVPKKPPSEPTSVLEISGFHDFLINFAKCCNPIPGEDVLGYITRGSGVSVHRRNCSNMKTLFLNDERIIEVKWRAERDLSKTKKTAPVYPVRLDIRFEDKVGMLAKITSTISNTGTNIKDAKLHTERHIRGMVTVIVESPNLAHIQQLIDTVKKVKGVISVKRI